MTAQTQNYRVIGSALKGVSLWGDEGWDYLTGEPDNPKPTPSLFYKSVPWLFRAINLRANAVASMPFALMQGKSEYDTSTDWQNKLGFLPNPERLLWLVEASLTLLSRAYLYRDRTAIGTKMLKYIAPNNAKPKDLNKGIDNFVFERVVDNQVKTFQPVKDIVYFWQPDPDKEIGPSDKSPAVSAMAACGVLLSVDVFADNFFKQGAVKATVFGVKNAPIESERLRLRDWLRQMLGGVKNSNKIEVVNADAVVPMTIGEGLAGLQNTDLTAEKREDISTALGIPQTLLFSTGAGGLGGGGVVEQDDVHFYDKTVIPECVFIASILNEQVFTPLGLKLVFKPETLDMYQQDEASRSQSVSTFMDFLVKCPTFDLFKEICLAYGYELTPGLETAAKAYYADKEKQAEEMRQATLQAVNKPPQEKPGQPIQEKPANEEPQQGAEAKADLKRWERKATKAIEKGSSADVNFESEFIPTDLAASIRARLANAKTTDDVHSAFSLETSIYQPAAKSEALILAEAINRAVSVLELEVQHG